MYKKNTSHLPYKPISINIFNAIFQDKFNITTIQGVSKYILQTLGAGSSQQNKDTYPYIHMSANLSLLSLTIDDAVLSCRLGSLRA